MTFSGNFMPRRFGQGKPQKPKVKTHRTKPVSVYGSEKLYYASLLKDKK